jgi:hypothetical protein
VVELIICEKRTHFGGKMSNRKIIQPGIYNTLLSTPTRSGKGVSNFTPTSLSCPGRVENIVFDFKGENFKDKISNELTDAQKDVYNAIKTDGWFDPDESMLFKVQFKNYKHRLYLLEKKGYLESKLFPNPNDSSPYSGILKYKKAKIKNKEYQ